LPEILFKRKERKDHAKSAKAKALRPLRQAILPEILFKRKERKDNLH